MASEALAGEVPLDCGSHSLINPNAPEQISRPGAEGCPYMIRERSRDAGDENACF